MSAAAGRGGRVIVGRKGQKIKGGHGLVAVAARVRQTDGQTWKGNIKGHMKGGGDIKRKKDRRVISVS